MEPVSVRPRFEAIDLIEFERELLRRGEMGPTASAVLSLAWEHVAPRTPLTVLDPARVIEARRRRRVIRAAKRWERAHKARRPRQPPEPHMPGVLAACAGGTL